MADENKQLNIQVREKVATLMSQNFKLVGGNSDYKVVFDFDDEWKKYNVKTALFVFGKETVPQVFEGNICNGVAINKSTVCRIGVFAGDIVTTTPAIVECIMTSITDIGGTPKDPTPSVYNQIIDLLNKYIEQGGGNEGGGNAVSPTVKIEEIANGHRVVITDVNGDHAFDVLNGEKGNKGDTYELTETDKDDIANLVLGLIPDNREVAY